MSQKRSIVIKGAKVHNLKNIDLELPKGKLIVITGLSGSGKSSLAFDTIYAEGQRRYIESLSSYARQFLGHLDKPDVDLIKGISPTIAIDQRRGASNPRSTVGTLTEIYDYFRVLFAAIGQPYCVECGIPLVQKNPVRMAREINEITSSGERYYLAAPVIKNQKGSHGHVFDELDKRGYLKVRLNGEVMPMEQARNRPLDRQEKHSIDVVFNQILVGQYSENAILAFVKQALDLGDGFMSLFSGKKEVFFSQFYSCPKCGGTIPKIHPRSFSFNSPDGACSKCTGLGTTMVVDPELVVPNKKLSLSEGAIRPWSKLFSNQISLLKSLQVMAKQNCFSLDVPYERLKEKDRKKVLFGQDGFEGVIPNLEKKYKNTDSDYVRREIEKYMRVQVCPVCEGKRLKQVFLNVKIKSYSIADLVNMSIDELLEEMNVLFAKKKNKISKKKLSKEDRQIGEQAFREIVNRLTRIQKIGMDYLTLDRTGVSLSGGELQRLRLSTQINSLLEDVIYILDEPSVGLHPRDNQKLIDTLKKLRDLGNTVIVVEHDEAMMREADHVVDMGPGAGKFGGEVVAQGIFSEIKKVKKSLTARYLNGTLEIPVPEKIRSGTGKEIKILGAKANNLKDLDVSIPLGKFVCFTGVSGSGKSTLVIDILAKALSSRFHRGKAQALSHRAILGVEYLDKVIDIDQTPIGRTPRSNPATYTGVFTYIRDLFVGLAEARIKGLKAGHFSFNVRGGRCETCQGEGLMKIGMQFLQDVYVPCQECLGTRYQKQILEIFYKGKNIADVLDMTVGEARNFFESVSIIYEKLNVLYEVGLGYLHLGQSATTLSGGEAQRIKLAAELSHRATGRTLYILDEPTTGLHMEDIQRLLLILNKLVDKGNTVLVIEHHLDVIKSADWVIDLGPSGGKNGGRIVAQGTPREVADVKESYTGQFLKRYF